MRSLAMKIIFLLMMMFFICTDCISQINNDLIIEQIERMSEDSSDEENDYSELIEAYWELLENPLNINGDDIDQLAEFRFISVFQLEKIKSYIKEYGDIQFIEELYEIEGMDDKSIEMIKDIICFEESKKKEMRFSDLKYGKHKVITQVDQCLNKKKGYSVVEDSLLYQNPNSIYLGSPQRFYLRYNYTYKDKLEYGFVVEKDPGEYLFKSNVNDSLIALLGDKCYTGFDFCTFHISVHNFGFLFETVVIGDYKISFGQGLCMGSGMAFTSKGGTLLRRGKKISPSKSANEAYYLRGVATTLKYSDFELCMFYSNKKTDANIVTYDSLTETPLEISSLQQTGPHRTYNEMIDRKVIRQQLYGLNLSYKNSNFQLGYTLHKTDLNAELNPDNNLYNLFYFRGKNIINQSLDFYYVLDKILFYGEAAMSGNKGLAGLAGVSFQPKGYIDFNMLYRNYAKDYQCLYSNAYSAGSSARNEEGWYLSSCISVASNWKYITSIDFYKSNWFRSTAHSPSHGYDFDTQMNYQPNSNTLFFIEYRNRNKMKNTSRTDIFQRFLIEEKYNMIRFHAAYKITDDITLKNRVEYHFNTNEDGKYNAYLIYQDILYNPNDKHYNIAFRYEIFNAEEGSVYAYENDVLYAFAVGGLSGKGIRSYLVGKIKVLERIQISGKIGLTIYDNKTEIGSGLETIYNNWRCDCKLQLTWSL